MSYTSSVKAADCFIGLYLTHCMLTFSLKLNVSIFRQKQLIRQATQNAHRLTYSTAKYAIMLWHSGTCRFSDENPDARYIPSSIQPTVYVCL